MGRAATAHGATDGRACILDRSDDRALRQEDGSTGDPPFGSPRTGPILSGAAEGSRQAPAPGGAIAGREIVLHEIWFQLPLPDRQRFGHRFSGMILKALGHRSHPAQEGD
jgi:hypothetical protein